VREISEPVNLWGALVDEILNKNYVPGEPLSLRERVQLLFALRRETLCTY
jgi:hypothetical protein